MAYRLLSFTSTVLFLFYVSSGETSTFDMCRNGTMFNSDANVVLQVSGPPRGPLTQNTSTTCTCLINVTYYVSNKVSVDFSRTGSSGPGCMQNMYDEAALNIKYEARNQPVNLHNDDLSEFSEKYDVVTAITLSITTHSICGSNYTIQLEEISRWYIAWFSLVTCSNPKTVVASSSSTAAPTALKPMDVSTMYMASTNESSRVVENNTPTGITGLIVGVVVGVGVGLLLLGAIIFAVFIFRRRRAKSQPSHNAPVVASYELQGAHASVSYGELRYSTQPQTGIHYDNPLASESDHAYSSAQDIDNSVLHLSDAVSVNDQTSEDDVDGFAQEPHSINDTDTTVVENDLYYD